MTALLLHTSREYEAELRGLRAHLGAMGERCEKALTLAVAMFTQHEASEADAVCALDGDIDRDEIEIDELVLRVLALRQPVAFDLRFLATTLKFVTDLERIGDKAVGIARRARELAGAPSMPPLPELGTLSTMAHSMLRGALDALLNADAETAEDILARDEQVNELSKSMQRGVVDWMKLDASHVRVGLTVIAVLRALERVADHATNLAEQVVFMVRGDDVRHRGKVLSGRARAGLERSVPRAL